MKQHLLGALHKCDLYLETLEEDPLLSLRDIRVLLMEVTSALTLREV